MADSVTVSNLCHSTWIVYIGQWAKTFRWVIWQLKMHEWVAYVHLVYVSWFANHLERFVGIISWVFPFMKANESTTIATFNFCRGTCWNKYKTYQFGCFFPHFFVLSVTEWMNTDEINCLHASVFISFCHDISLLCSYNIWSAMLNKSVQTLFWLCLSLSTFDS